MKTLTETQLTEVTGAGWFTKRKSSGGQSNKSRPRYKSNKTKSCRILDNTARITGTAAGIAALGNPVAGGTLAIVSASATVAAYNEGCY